MMHFPDSSGHDDGDDDDDDGCVDDDNLGATATQFLDPFCQKISFFLC